MNLIKISLTISLLGIITLLILANTIEPKLTKIKDITIKQLNKKVKILGKIENIKIIENNKTRESFQILTISDETGKVDAVFNTKPNLNLLNLKINQNLIITGRVTQYKDKLQIQAEKIILTLLISIF